MPKRVFIVDLSAIDVNESLRVFINPEIVATDGEVEMEEGCLSFPEMYHRITRPARVTVRAIDLEGNRFEMSADGVTARAILHEYDHLEGKLFIDYLSPLARALEGPAQKTGRRVLICFPQRSPSDRRSADTSTTPQGRPSDWFVGARSSCRFATAVRR